MSKHKLTLAAMVLVSACLAAWAADEIVLSGNLKVSNGNYYQTKQVASLQIDQTTQGSQAGIQEIGTGTHELVYITPDVGNAGVGYLRNLTTNSGCYIELGAQGATTNFLPVMKLKSGELMFFRMHPTSNLYAKAFSNACNLEVWILED